jgi:hypothetical protein
LDFGKALGLGAAIGVGVGWDGGREEGQIAGGGGGGGAVAALLEEEISHGLFGHDG